MGRQYRHACDYCGHRCPIGDAVDEGTYDEYIKEKIQEDYPEQDVSNKKFMVIVTECPDF